jgi:hypothetical protein
MLLLLLLQLRTLLLENLRHVSAVDGSTVEVDPAILAQGQQLAAAGQQVRRGRGWLRRCKGEAVKKGVVGKHHLLSWAVLF